METKHFILELMDMFPNGFNISMTRSEVNGKNHVVIMINDTDDGYPFKIMGPEEEVTSQSLIAAINEIREGIEKVRTNKDQWIESIRKKIEEEEKQKASKASSSTSKKKTKKREGLEKKYKDVVKVSPEDNLSDADLEKAIKNASDQKSMFDNKESEKKEEKKESPQLKEGSFEGDDDKADDKEEQKEDIPVIPGGNDSDKTSVTVNDDNKESQEEADNTEQESSTKEESDFLKLGNWEVD